MKTEELIALSLAAAFTGAWKAAKEVLNPSGQQFDNGWRYFDDGTSIAPQGNYYQGGQIIWSPAK